MSFLKYCLIEEDREVEVFVMGRENGVKVLGGLNDA